MAQRGTEVLNLLKEDYLKAYLNTIFLRDERKEGKSCCTFKYCLYNEELYNHYIAVPE